MLNSKLKLVMLTVFCFLSLQIYSQNQKEEMAYVKGGSYIPLYGADSAWVNVADFLLDSYPVTNEEFLTFVLENP